MALKVGLTEVVTNARALQNISTVDAQTALVIDGAIRAQNNVLIIYDSTGAVVRRIYGARDV